jgi:hypothetical protein
MKTCFNFKPSTITSTPQKIEIVALFKAKYTKSMKKKMRKKKWRFYLLLLLQVKE